MTPKYTVNLIKADSSESEPITRFGGQPHWLNQPQWPLSAETKSPMQFVCQILLSDSFVADHGNKIAYLFISGDDGGEQTWSHDEGENCVIVQSPNQQLPIPSIPWPPLNKLDTPTGPTVSEQIYIPELTAGEDPEYVEQENRTEKLGDHDEFKLGGTPVFAQDDDFVLDHLVLQFNKYDLPFELNIGVGFLTINHAATEGAFLWQSD